MNAQSHPWHFTLAYCPQRSEYEQKMSTAPAALEAQREEVERLRRQGRATNLDPSLLMQVQKRIFLVLGPTKKSIGLYPMVHGVNSQVMDGLQELSFTMTPFMVLERTRLRGEQACMGGSGPKSPLLTMLLIWLTGMDNCMLLG